ncbi:MAG: hypothetical protein BWK73_10660 [Thiothrix lacustris]|uniref:Uncharacterized protein n=1 Tax=Thiothrix lacustris TaxID=525917 RepID=A0A1Y1QUU6_9GAMM|nr:MAG: hypothetical protein BWK73_10660 [Thiothrix lacustris]
MSDVFHRLNLEYLASLQGLQPPALSDLLETGIRSNLQRVGESEAVLPGLRHQVEWMAALIARQGAWLQQDKERQRKQLLSNSHGDFILYRAGMSVDFAGKKLSEALRVSANDAQQRVALAVQMLKDGLQVNPHNYRAHFELGWAYLFMLKQLPEATFHLEAAAQQAQASDPLFARFARRHLADAWHGQQQFSKAAEIALSILPEAATDALEVRYELSRYLSAAGEMPLAAQHLAQVVGRSAIHYVQAQAEPDFAGQGEIQTVLEDLRSIRVQRIQHYVHANWQQDALATLPLPDQIDSGELFNQVVDQHERVMTHLPYATLSQREKQIGDRILNASRQRVIREVRLRSRHYEQVAEKERQRWSWVNQTGGALVHLSTILLLASLMFYLLRFALDLLGVGNLLNADTLVGNILGSMLLLGITGVTLLQFVPWGMKKLLLKQLELDNTVSVLKSSS